MPEAHLDKKTSRSIITTIDALSSRILSTTDGSFVEVHVSAVLRPNSAAGGELTGTVYFCVEHCGCPGHSSCNYWMEAPISTLGSDFSPASFKLCRYVHIY